MINLLRSVLNAAHIGRLCRQVRLVMRSHLLKNLLSVLLLIFPLLVVLEDAF